MGCDGFGGGARFALRNLLRLKSHTRKSHARQRRRSHQPPMENPPRTKSKKALKHSIHTHTRARVRKAPPTHPPTAQPSSLRDRRSHHTPRPKSHFSTLPYYPPKFKFLGVESEEQPRSRNLFFFLFPFPFLSLPFPCRVVAIAEAEEACRAARRR